MSSVPDGLRYTKDHEWARFEGGRAVVGVTEHAVEQLGDIVLVDITAKIGTAVEAGKIFGVVDSTKTTSDLFSPVSGTVAAINDALKDSPQTVNEAPYGAGWMIALETASDGSDLMDAAAYAAYLGTL